MKPLAVDAQSRLGSAHARFGRAVLGIYLGAAAVAIVLLVAVTVTDRDHESRQLTENLALQNQVRAEVLSEHLALLATELNRLGRRTEVDLADQDVGPERALLEFSHHESTFFNEGVAILGAEGRVLWSEPATFLPVGTSVETKSWFQDAVRETQPDVEPVEPDQPDDAKVLVLAPIERGGHFAGALVGGLDLSRDGAMRVDPVEPEAATILATTDGHVVYPARPPEFSRSAGWLSVFSEREPHVANVDIDGIARVIAAAPIAGTRLVHVSLANRDLLLAPARRRMRTRLGAGLVLALAPLALLVLLLQRSLAVFQRNEATAVREERLKTLGEASNLIAHEIKNSLNNFRVGIDVIVRRGGAASSDTRVIEELKREVERLSQFTGELMTFSKGVTPRPVPIDLARLVPEIASLSREAASEIGASIDVSTPDAPLTVRADPSLVHVVISNLVTNAMDAVASRRDGGGRVQVRIERAENSAWVRVVDNGPGVPLEIRDHLFEPFVTGKPSGVGIGLALSRRIAQAHGGDLVLDADAPGASGNSSTARSPLGGASFSFSLPLQEAS